MTKPIVAIIGRQNVGKSTLLNRLAGRRIAIVTDIPGTTRDRIMASVSWQGIDFTIVDTGGLEMKPTSHIAQAVKEQAEIAIDEADAIIFLVDAVAGITPDDTEIANILRRTNKPIVLVANKADNAKIESAVADFYRLGLGESLAISAYHGKGTAELLNNVGSLLPYCPPPTEAGPEVVKVALIGRPGVGKSTLLNAIIGQERAIVGEKPGTTRDAIDTLFDFTGQSVLIIDTAGIKRRGRVGVDIEYFSMLRALRAIDRADVTVLVLDATELVTAQDMHIAGYVKQAEKGILTTVNKWDMAPTKDTAEANRYITSQLNFIPYAPLLFVSAKTGQDVDRIMPQVLQIHQERNRRVPTSIVNTVVQQAAAEHELPRSGGKQLKIFYTAQADVNPPTFVFFVNDAKLVHFSYRRYLENRLRRSFGFTGTPIRLVFKARG